MRSGAILVEEKIDEMITRETLEMIDADLNAEYDANANKSKNAVAIINTDLNVPDFSNEGRLVTHRNSVVIVKRLGSMTGVNADYNEHLKIYNQILAYYNVLGIFFGVDVRYDWKMTQHFNFWFTNLILSVANCYLPYNLYFHISNGDYIKILEPFALCGILFTSDLKWIVFIEKWKVLFSLFFVPKNLCEKNSTFGTRAATITAGLKRTRSVIRAYTIGVIAVLLFYVAVPIKFYLVDGIFIPLMPIKTPFLDDNTLKGWLMSSAIHCILGLYGGFATIMFGAGFLICISNYIILVDLIALDWEDLNDMWNGESATSTAYRHAFLNNICKKLQDMKSYMNQVRGMFELKFFIYFIISFLGEVLCLYQIDKSDWIPGYTIASMVFIEMMFYCYVGTQLSITDDKMCDFIQRTDWYLFDAYSQNVLQLTLHQCQQPNLISLKYLGTLNMVTGIQIIKGIYTYYTILTELF